MQSNHPGPSQPIRPDLLCSRRREIDNPPASVWTAVSDLDNHLTSVFPVRYLDLGAERQPGMGGCQQSLVEAAAVGGAAAVIEMLLQSHVAVTDAAAASATSGSSVRR